MTSSEIELAGYVPGALGRVCALQAQYYATHWRFTAAFECKVAAEMAAFLARFDPTHDLFLTALVDGEVMGGLTVDGGEGDGDIAHLRWFITSDALRGTGVGQRMFAAAIAFLRARDFDSAYLWTFAGLDAARALYDRAGFQLVEERDGDSWGTRVTEQKFVLALG